MNKFFLLLFLIVTTVGLIFNFGLDVAKADDNVIAQGGYCGFYQPWYVTPTMQSATLKDKKCAEGTECIYAAICRELPSSSVSGYAGKPEFVCDSPTLGQERASLLNTCIKDGPEKHNTDAAKIAEQVARDKVCLAQATSTERGIFTKGLSDKCFACGECTQKDVFQEFVNIFSFILQISGSLAVLMMVLGGLLYMTAAGDPQKLQRAKGALTAAIVGIIIVLTAFILISFVLNLLGYTNAGSWFSPTLQ